MPACWRCGRVQSSAELRRTPRGHVCFENGPGTRCANLARDRRQAEREQRAPRLFEVTQ